MGGEENEQMGVGEDLVCFDVEKEYGGERERIRIFVYSIHIYINVV